MISRGDLNLGDYLRLMIIMTICFSKDLVNIIGFAIGNSKTRICNVWTTWYTNG